MIQLTEIGSVTAANSAYDDVGQRDEIDAIRKQMFLDFCNTLEAKGIPYVILAGHRDYPEKIASDIDFMVTENDFKRLPAILSDPACSSGGKIVQILQHETSAIYYVLAKQVGNKIAYLHPDSADNYRQNGRLWLYSDSVLETRRKSASGFWIPATKVEFEYYFVKRVEKTCLEMHHLEQLSALLAEDDVGCRSVLARLAPIDTANSITTAILNLDVEWFSTQRHALRKTLLCNPKHETVFRRMCNQYKELQRLVRRVLSPTGFIIAVIGPDGSGKTTIIEHIAKEFAPAFRHVERFHLRPHFEGASTGPVVTNPHSRGPRGRLVSSLKMGLFLADYWGGWLRYITPAKIRSTLIVFDRYYHDMLVDTRRYRLPNGFSVARWFMPFIPQPDLWLILTARPELLVARKGEISLVDGQRLNVAYQSLARDLLGAVVIDTSNSLEQTLVEAVAAVRERLESRAQESLKNMR